MTDGLVLATDQELGWGCQLRVGVLCIWSVHGLLEFPYNLRLDSKSNHSKRLRSIWCFYVLAFEVTVHHFGLPCWSKQSHTPVSGPKGGNRDSISWWRSSKMLKNLRWGRWGRLLEPCMENKICHSLRNTEPQDSRDMSFWSQTVLITPPQRPAPAELREGRNWPNRKGVLSWIWQPNQSQWNMRQCLLEFVGQRRIPSSAGFDSVRIRGLQQLQVFFPH